MFKHFYDLPHWANEIIEATYDASARRNWVLGRQKRTRIALKQSDRQIRKLANNDVNLINAIKGELRSTTHEQLGETRKASKYNIRILMAILIGIEKCRGNSELTAFLFFFLAGTPFGNTKIDKECPHLRALIPDIDHDEITKLLPTINHKMPSVAHWIGSYRQTVTRLILSFYDGNDRKFISVADKKDLEWIHRFIREGESYISISEILSMNRKCYCSERW